MPDEVFLQTGVGPFPQTAANVNKQLGESSNKLTHVGRVFGEKHLLPTKFQIGSPRAAMVHSLTKPLEWRGGASQRDSL
jgi:hypothetical protein